MRKQFKKVISILLVAILLISTGQFGQMTKAADTVAVNNIPVILYHRIVENATNEWTDTSISNFRAHMDYLEENGYTTLSSEEYVSILKGEATAPSKPILLTFDDATPDFITNALPVLEAKGMKSVLFVITDWIDGDYSISEAQLQDIADNHTSVSIESHSKTHDEAVWTSSITYQSALDELTAAKTYLNGITRKDPVLFAYPYGNNNSDAQSAAAESGIEYAFKVGYPNSGAYAMGRHYTLDVKVAQFAASIGGPAPAVDPTTVTVYHETFENGAGKATTSGGATITPVTDMVFDGNDDGAAIYVDNRSNDWDAVDFSFEDIGLENGKSYTVTVTGFVYADATVLEGAQAVLSTVNSYTWLANVNYVAGEAFTLTKEFTVDTSKDTKLRVQSDSTGKTVPFYIGEILIAEKQALPTETIETVYHETFENGAGKATTSGGATITPVTDMVFDGNDDGAAIYVDNRNNDWDAVDFSFSDIGLENGETYTVTVTGFVYADATVLEGGQAVLSMVDSYTWLANVNYVAGEAFTLTKEFTVDTSKDTKLRVQSDSTGKTVPFYIGDILITKKVISDGGGEKPPRDPAIPFTTIDFEDQSTGEFGGRAGTEILTVTNEANHTDGGEYALKVEGRKNNWHGPAIRVEKYVDEGYEYNISVWVKLISPDSAQITLSTQVGSASASYNNIAKQTVSSSGGWVQLQGKYRYNSATDEFLQIYVESSDTEASFYIDDFSFESTGSGPIKVQKDLTPIKDAYQDYFLIGNAVSAADLEGARLELLKHHHNVVTAENAMKPDYTYDENRKFNFDAEDDLVAKIEKEGLQLVGHVLVWHQQMPIWLSTAADGTPLDREEALDNLRTHITTVVEHYGDKVISWDVVNEAIADGLTTTVTTENWQSALRKSPWYDAIGPDYIEQSFKIAKEVLKENGWTDVKLYYNDYNEDNQQKASAIYSMVKDINDRYAAENDGELLIDGIGMQSHYNINTNVDNVRLSLEKFSSLGVEISVTELDITAGSDSKLSDDQANAQGYLYAALFNLYKEYAEDIARVTIWGLNDSTSWRTDRSPLLFDANLQAKQAYYAIMDPDKFMDEHPPVEREIKQANALFGTPVIDGDVDSVWSEVYGMKIDQFQSAWQGASGVAKALWDEENLYVLIQVQDEQLDNSNPDPWEQDSVEIFVDQTNSKSAYYEEGNHGQYRVTFENMISFNPDSIAEGFESATSVSGTNYTVEVKIPLTAVTPVENMKIGFDVQINDAKGGSRQSAAAWNDTTGTGYMDPSVFGELTLVRETDPNSGGSGSSRGSGSSKGSGSSSETGNTGETADNADAITVEATVDTDGNYTAVVNQKALTEVLNNVKDGKVKVEVKGAEQGNNVVVKFDFDFVKAASEANVKEIEVNTGSATVELPVSLFNGSKEGAEIELQVVKVDTSKLPEEVISRVGKNTVFEFNLRVGGEKLSNFGANQKVQVSYPYTLEAGVKPATVVVYYIDDNGNFEVIKNGRYNNGAVQFKAKHFSKYVAIPVEISFKDIYEASWATESIETLAAREIVKGVSDESFLPMKEVTRAEFVQMIVQTFDLKSEGTANPFSDVAAGDWYEKAVITAYELGIVKGKTDGSFGVNEKISRQDMAVITFSALKAAGINMVATSGAVQFEDGATISEYAKEAVGVMQQAGIINGMPGGKFAPIDTANRAQAAVILFKLLDEL